MIGFARNAQCEELWLTGVRGYDQEEDPATLVGRAWLQPRWRLSCAPSWLWLVVVGGVLLLGVSGCLLLRRRRKRAQPIKATAAKVDMQGGGGGDSAAEEEASAQTMEASRGNA